MSGHIAFQRYGIQMCCHEESGECSLRYCIPVSIFKAIGQLVILYLCIATPKYVLPLRNMYWHSEICIATPIYTLSLQNISFHSEICFATPKYALPLRNYEICFATPKYALPLPKYALLPRKKAIPWNCAYSPTVYLYSDICFATPKYALPLQNMHCYPEKNDIPLKFYLLTHSVPINHSNIQIGKDHHQPKYVCITRAA